MEKETIPNHFHTKSPEEIFKELKSSPDGLSKKEAISRIEKYGPNQLLEKKSFSLFFLLLSQFKSALVYILIIAGIFSFFLERYFDVYIIAAVILINAVVGFFQEYKAEKAIKALKKMVVSQAKVFRDGKLIKIEATQLVPGDVIYLEEGDRIPADARLISTKNFRTVESSLTGESVPSEKNISIFPEKLSLADRKNMVWMGTFVAGGTAKAIITSTGAKTAIGTIAESIKQIKTEPSHFEKKMTKLSKLLGILSLAGALVIFLVGFLIRKMPFWDIFEFTIAELVSIIPEGLPVLLTIVLAVGAKRMARRNAIVRRRTAIETLSVVDIIATDKTGTLTKNTMNVEKIILPGEPEISVSGSGWKPIGDFSQSGKRIAPFENARLAKLLNISAVCNSAHLIKTDETYSILGDPTEAALVVLAEKAGLKKEVAIEKENKIDDFPFNQDLRLRGSLVHGKDFDEIYVTGAPESILEKATHFQKKSLIKKITEKDKKEFSLQINSLTNKAMRVLAIAYKKVPADTSEIKESDFSELVLLGFVGMVDPPREEVKDAIQKAKDAGIRIIMTTGDHKNTAIAIAKKIELTDEENPQALIESELKEMTPEEFHKAVKTVSVFARLTPAMKLKIAGTLQDQGHIVAMTGDGVNDAPALKKADIGISMGIIGTDVARASSSIVLADDNFASIVSAIEEGRIVFTNTRQTSSFLLITNFAELTTLVVALILGFPLPLLPTQILWLNIVTDTFPAIALANEPGRKNILQEKPQKSDEEILSKKVIPLVILMTVLMTTLAILVFKSYLNVSLSKARTGAFVVMAATQLFNTLNMRDMKNSIFKRLPQKNKYILPILTISFALLAMVLYVPFFQNAFDFTALTFLEISFLIVLSSSAFWVGEVYKLLRNKINNKNKFNSTPDTTIFK